MTPSVSSSRVSFSDQTMTTCDAFSSSGDAPSPAHCPCDSEQTESCDWSQVSWHRLRSTWGKAHRREAGSLPPGCKVATPKGFRGRHLEVSSAFLASGNLPPNGPFISHFLKSGVTSSVWKIHI